MRIIEKIRQKKQIVRAVLYARFRLCKTIEEWQDKFGHDLNSLTGQDPMFMEPQVKVAKVGSQ